MKTIRLVLLILFASILSACQSQATPVAPPTTISIPTTISKLTPTASKVQQLVTPPTAAPAPTSGTSAPAIHSSSSDPNASNRIVVRDQAISNNSLVIDSVTATQAGWIALYFDKGGQPGELVTYVPVTAGKSSSFVISLSNLKNPIIQINSIPGHQLLAMLTAGGAAPGDPVRDNNKLVMAAFNILVP